MKMKKFIAVLSVATMAAGLAVGCGSADSGSSDDKSSKGDWDSSNDITIVSREDGSGTRGAFIELFGIEEKKDGEKVDMTTDDAQITNSTSVMLTTVAGDDYAIGYVSLGSLNDTVKAVKIDGAEASVDNVKNGSYKVVRPFNIVLGKKASEAYKVTADKTGKLAKEAKLRMKIADLKSQINEIYKEIGETVYQKHTREGKYEIEKEVEEKCTKIDVLSDEIESNLKQCLELKDKRQCPSCFAEIEKDVKFCPKCGTKQEEIKEEPAKEVEIIENSDSNENEQTESEEKSNLEKTVTVESDPKLDEDKTVEHISEENE